MGGGQAGTPLCKLLLGIFGHTGRAERRGSPFPSENCLVPVPPLTLPAGGPSCLPKAGSCSPGPCRGPRTTQRGKDGPPGSLGASSWNCASCQPCPPGQGLVVGPKQPWEGGLPSSPPPSTRSSTFQARAWDFRPAWGPGQVPAWALPSYLGRRWAAESPGFPENKIFVENINQLSSKLSGLRKRIGREKAAMWPDVMRF